jgi:hypothetical protein
MHTKFLVIVPKLFEFLLQITGIPEQYLVKDPVGPMPVERADGNLITVLIP